MIFRSMLFTCVAICAGPAYAQQDEAAPAAGQASPGASAAAGAEPAADQDSLSEVVVAARKVSEPLQKVPVALTAFSAADLKQQSVTTLADVMGQVPSLFLQPAVDDPQSMTINMRGRVQDNVNLGVDPSVGVYVDGIYDPRQIGVNGALVDLDRIEVLRGPQGTLYGRNTTAGAISIFTKNPTQESGGSIDVTGGNYGTWNVVAIENAPISDSSAFRFVMQHGGSDGYGHNGDGQRLESDNNGYYRAKFLQDFGNDVEAVLSAHYEKNKSGGAIVKLLGLSPAGGGLPEGGVLPLEIQAATGLTIPQSVALLKGDIAQSSTNFYDNTSTQPSGSTVEKWDSSLAITAKLPFDLEFRSFTGVQGFSRFSDFSGPIAQPFFADDLTTHDTYYSQEFQILGSEATFNWVAGVYGGQENGSDVEVLTVVPLLSPGTSNGPSAEIHNTSLAAYAQGVWEFLPGWRLTSGLRDSYDIREAIDDVYTTNGSGTVTCVTPAPGVESTDTGAAQCPRTFRNSYSRPTWLISVDYQFTPDILGYEKIAQGYRSGGENLGGAVEAETFAPFKPETNIEYETGVKSEFFDHRLRLNLAGYYDSYTNLQVTTSFLATDGTVASAVTNAAAATIKGLEFESAVVVGGGLTLRSSAALTDAHYDDFVDFTGNRTNQPFAVPKWTGSLSANEKVPTRLGEVSAQLDYSWKSRTDLGPTAVDRDAVTQGGYGLLNARVQWHVDRWDADIAMFGKNITNKHYYTQVSANDTSVLGVDFGYAGAPAVYGVEITKAFGRP
jgi:iron complex outermembrane receptor protein